MKLEVPDNRFEDIVDVLEGKVTGVEGQKVFIFGTDSIRSTKSDSSTNL